MNLIPAGSARLGYYQAAGHPIPWIDRHPTNFLKLQCAPSCGLDRYRRQLDPAGFDQPGPG
ncbi:hypothetical protein [Synechococcus sp. UW140]|uniref:hypothetical protein n=1 Tax=Synechococcus sp. UW140 TaxID=368503 RepID=UPI0025D67C25|nr:hypothetical protein [Synechococcus sp. UW140]